MSILEPRDLTLDEQLGLIAEDSNIKHTEWFGKYLLLHEVLRSMDKAEASAFLDDTLMMLEDEIANKVEEIK